LQLSVQNTW